MDWEPDWNEVAFSDRVFVAPDCSAAYHGNFWASNRLTPLVQEAARSGSDIAAEDILDQLLMEDSPMCADVGYFGWGAVMQKWYDDWTQQVYDDLELYTQFPELLP